MKTTIQRVSEASVAVNGEIVGAIKTGLLVLLGVEDADEQSDIDWLTQKIATLRIFPDEKGLMNKSVQDINGEILVISQFTLFASTKKGTRPSFTKAGKPDFAKKTCDCFITTLGEKIETPIAQGIFGADMKVALVNDGPVTINIDTKNKF